MENDSSMLVGSNSISSHEIEIVSPTPAVGQQQTSHQDTTVEDLTTAAMAWMLIRVVLIYAQLFLVGFVEQRSNNGLNLYVQPFCLAFPFYYPVCKRPYNGVILNLLVVLYPTFVTFVVVVVGAILSPVAVVFLPWLLVSFLLARLLQFIRHGDAYDNLVLLKFYIRTWIYYLYLYSVAPALAIFLAIAWSAPSLKNIFQDYRVLQLGYQQMTSITNALQGWEFICSGISFMLIMSTIFLILAFKFMPQVQLDLSESGINIPEAVLEIADCLNAFFCMTIILKKTNAPALKHHKILGLETWKWIQAIIFIVIIYNVITIFTRMSVWMLQRFVAHDKPGSQTTDTWTRRSSILQKIFRRRYLVYWGNGMKHSINFLLTSLLFLVAWLLYFRSHLKNTPIYWEFGIRTCLSFLACAFLWLIKSCVILSWEASSIYVRLQSKILQGGRQLYFLGIMGRHDYDIFNLLYHDEMPTRRENRGVLQLFSRVQHMFTFSLVLNLNTYFHRKTDPVDEWETEKKLSEKKNNRAKEFLLMQRDRTPTIYGIQQAALYFLMAKSKLVEEKYTSIILKKLETFNQADDDNRGGVERILKRLIGEENWNDFQHQLHQHMGPSESITFETRLQAWMEMAHNNCLFLANTLSSAKEVVDCLNNIISSILIFASFIIWLLLTKMATAQVLVLITAPLLAGSFIFQNTCKVLFEGIMFVYVVHPFNVGDLCIIDEKMMEVRTVGVWKTTFSKVGTQVEVIYSNSDLANKSIINHKTDFDWNDSVELDVSSLSKGKIKNAIQDIEKYLDGDKDKFALGYNSVEVLTAEDMVKLIVYFRHKVNLKNSNFFECLKEKRKLRSEFVLEAENLVDRNEMKSQ